MKNEISVVAENTTTTVAEIVDYKEKALEYLSSMGNKLPTKHQTQFIEMASAFGLNPFKREIYAVGYGENWNIITGYEVYLKRAERIGKLDGWDATVDGSGENMTSTVTIYRKDWSHPFKHTVLFSEVCQKTKDGKLNSVWSKMPSFMCRKVAIAQAFRLCFPDEFGGMPYTSDEMPSEEQMKNVTPVAEEIIETPKKIAKSEKPKLYTKDEANKVAELLGATYPNGEPIFTKEDKDVFRKVLVNEGGQACIDSVNRTIDERMDAFKDKQDENTVDGIEVPEGIF